MINNINPTPATMSAEELKSEQRVTAVAIKAAEKQAAEIIEQWRAVPMSEKLNTPKEQRLIRQADELQKSADYLKKYAAILRNNYRVKRWQELAPVLGEILDKYAGKPYGERTAEKMRAELFDRARAYFYIDRAHSWNLEIIEARADGCTDPTGERFTIYQNKPHFLTDENRIASRKPSGEVPVIAWTCYGLKPYTEKPAALIEQLNDLKAQAIEAGQKLRKLCEIYNGFAPEGFDRLDPARTY